MDISFKRFSKKYWWLFVIAVLIPLLLIGGYCFVYRRSCLDETIWATIISGIVSYIGTIAWGIFIFYESWQRKVEQDYKERPILEVQAKLSDKIPLDYQMYEKYEVEEILNHQLEIHGLKQAQEKSHIVKYVCVSITNYGLSLISDMSLLDVYLDDDKNYIHQGKYGYLTSLDNPKTLLFKDKWVVYVAIDETLFNTLPEGYKHISIYLKLKHNAIATYCVALTINTCGRGTYGQGFKIYNENEYNKLKRVNKKSIISKPGLIMFGEKIKNWFSKSLQIIWYCILLLASSIYVGFNMSALLNDSILKDFRGEHIIFILWFVLLIFPLFDTFEGFGFKIGKAKKEQMESELNELYKKVLTKEDIKLVDLEGDFKRIQKKDEEE